MVSGRVLASVALAACLSGCADETVFGPGEPFNWNASQWSVSDRPDLDELQIVGVKPQAAGLGTAAVYRFDAGNVPDEVYAAAVQGWFLTHGRHCTASSHSATEDQADTYIFQYSCWVPTNSLD